MMSCRMRQEKPGSRLRVADGLPWMKTGRRWRSLSQYRLPENAEGAIVGCVLLCPEVRPEVARLISESDFVSPAFGAMFAAAMELKEPDSVVFREKVKARGYALPDGFFNGLTEVAAAGEFPAAAAAGAGPPAGGRCGSRRRASRNDYSRSIQTGRD